MSQAGAVALGALAGGTIFLGLPIARMRGLPKAMIRVAGRPFMEHVINPFASRGLREFYLLTTTAEEYFRKRGFKTIDRDEVHPQLLSSREFQDACPTSATCMRLVMLA